MNSRLSSESLGSLSDEKKMSRREEVMRMREERLREKEGHLTFQPTIIKKPTKGNATAEESSNVSRFEKLYSEAKKRKDTERKNPQYSFKPTITSMGQTRQRSATPEGTSNRLYDAPGAGRPRRSTSVDKKSKQRSFSPQITQRAKSIERSGSLSSPTTRLYSQAQTQKENRQALAEKLNKEDSKECTFNPKTNTSVEKSSNLKTPSVPLAERMDKYLALREKRMQELKEKRAAQEAQTATFKPVKYTKNRSRSTERSRGAGDSASVVSTSSMSERGSPDDTVTSVFERLSGPLAAKNKKPVVVEDKDEKEYTYRPQLVTKRAPSPKRLEEEIRYGGVHNRLYQKGNEQRREVELKKEELRKEMEKDNTFNPHVPHHRSSPDSPYKGAVFERLFASRQLMNGVLNQVRTEFENDYCTFRPEINHVSEDLSLKKNTKPVHVRLAEKGKVSEEEMLKRKAKKEEEELGECTFSPVIGKNSAKVLSSKRQDKVNVFERLTSGSALDSPPVQENRPENVPKVVRKSVENGSPGKDKAKSPADKRNKTDFLERLERVPLERSRGDKKSPSHEEEVQNTESVSKDEETQEVNENAETDIVISKDEETQGVNEDADTDIVISKEEEAQLQQLMAQKMVELTANMN